MLVWPVVAILKNRQLGCFIDQVPHTTLGMVKTADLLRMTLAAAPVRVSSLGKDAVVKMLWTCFRLDAGECDRLHVVL